MFPVARCGFSLSGSKVEHFGLMFPVILSLSVLCFSLPIRGVEMGHSSESLGLHRGEESGQFSKACPQQNPKFQGRIKQIGSKHN